MSTDSYKTLDRYLREAAERQASDVFLIAGEPPVYRVSGELDRADEDPLSAAEVERMAFAAVGEDRARRIGPETGSAVANRSVEGVAEARVVVTRSSGALGVTARILPSDLPDPRSARVPQALLDAALSSHGLIVVTGLTGSGKNTLALMLVEHINAGCASHVITIEDPVGLRLKARRALIEQQEVGTDVPSYEEALKAVLWRDPDVILVGEIRNLTVLQACVTAVQTGHLVITALHAPTPEAAIQKMLDVQPEEMRPVFRRSLASALRAVAAITLIPRAKAPGRVPAYGLLIPDDAMRNALAEGTWTAERAPLPPDSQRLSDDIEALKDQGLITADSAREARLLSAGIQSV